MKRGRTHGAALVSSRMFLFLRSRSSGRVCRCFSSELRRSSGLMGEASIVGATSLSLSLWSSEVIAEVGDAIVIVVPQD